MDDQKKHVRDMTPAERAAALADLKRGAVDNGPLPHGDKMARDMTDAERKEWLAEHRKRFG